MGSQDYGYAGSNIDKDLEPDYSKSGGVDSTGEMTKRNVVFDSVGGAYTGFKNNILDTGKWTNSIREELPAPFKETWKTYDETKDTLLELHKSAVKQTKPILGQIAKAADALVPASFQRVKKLTTGLKETFYEPPGGDYRQSPEELRESATKAMMDEVFKTSSENKEETPGEQEKIKKENKLKKVADVVVGEQIEKDRYDQNLKLFSRMDSNLQKLGLYQEKVSASVDRKSLELSFRKYMLIAEVVQQLRNSEVRQTNQLQAIATNTALPETKKIHLSARVQETMKRRMNDSVTNRMFGEDSVFSLAKKRVVADIGTKIEDFKGQLEKALFITEGAGTAQDAITSSGSTAEGIGTIVGGKKADALRESIIKKIMPEFANNPKFQEFGYRLATAVMNPQYGLDKLKNSNTFKDLSDGNYGHYAEKAMDYASGLLSIQQGDKSLEGGYDFKQALEAADQTKRLNVVQIEVVPGYLSRILREVTMHRTGREDIEMVEFDPISGEFTTNDVIEKNALKVIEDNEATNSGVTDIKNLTNKIREDLGLEENTKEAIVKLITSQMGSKESLTGDAVRNSKAYLNGAEDHRKTYDKIAELLDSDGLDKHKFVYGYEKGIDSVRKNLKSGGAVLQQLRDAGLEKTLLKLGVISKDENGALSVNDDPARERVERSAIADSDINVKKDIKAYSGKKSLRAIKKLKVATWKYKDDARGKGQKIGPMAQDLNKELGEEVAPGGKKVDLVSANGANMAAIQELAKGQEEIQSELGINNADVANNQETKKPGFIRNLINKFKKPKEEVQVDAEGAAEPKKEEVKNKDSDKKNWNQLDYLNAINENISLMHETVKTKGFGISLGDLKLPGVNFNNVNLPNVDLNAIGDKAKKLVDPLINTGNRYVDTLQSLLLSGIRDGGNAILSGLGSAKDGIKNFWNSKDFKLKDKGQWLADKVVELSGKALTFGQKFLFETVPEGFNKLKNLGKTISDKTKDILNGPVDVYLKDESSPVLLATRMRAGVYINSKTNEVIKNVGDLVEANCDILDASRDGEVALRWSDAANGLFDSQGRPLKTIKGMLWSIGVGALNFVGKKIKDGFNWAVTGPSFLTGLTETLSRFTSSIGDFFSGKLGFSLTDIRQVTILAQVRDLIAIGKNKKFLQEIYKRDLKDERGLSGAGFLASMLGKKENENRVSENKENAEENKQPGTSENHAVKSAEKVASSIGINPETIKEAIGLKDKAMAAYKNVTSGIKGSDSFVGPMRPGEENTSASGVFNRAKKRLEAAPGAGLVSKLFNKLTKKNSEGVQPQPNEETTKEVPKVSEENKKPGFIKKLFTKAEKKEVNPTEPKKEEAKSEESKNFSFKALIKKIKKPKEEAAVAPEENKKPGFIKNLVARAEKVDKAKVLTNIGKTAGKLGSFLMSGKAGQSTTESDGTALGAVKSNTSKTRSLGDGTLGKSTSSDIDGDGNRDGGSTEQLQRNEVEEKERKTVEANKALEAAKRAQADNNRFAASESAVMDLVKGAGGLISMLASGAGAVFSGIGALTAGASAVGAATSGVAGTVVKGALGGAWKLATAPYKLGASLINKGGTAIAGRIASTYATGGITGLMKGGLSTTLKVLNIARTAAIATGGVAAIAGGGATVVRLGLGFLLGSNPLGWAVTAGIVGYQLYKYFTRNSLNKFEKLRAVQYGFNTESKDLHRLMELEGYLLDDKINYANGVASLNTKNVEVKDILKMMDIDKEDKDKAERFNTWFQRRFLPFFLNHLTAYYAADKKQKITEVEKLDEYSLGVYLEKAKFLSGPYDVLDNPFSSEEPLKNTKDEIPEMILALKNTKKTKEDPKKKLSGDVANDSESLKNQDEKRKRLLAENLTGAANEKNKSENLTKPNIVPEIDSKIKTNSKDVLNLEDGGSFEKDLGGKYTNKEGAALAQSLNTADGPMYSAVDGSQWLVADPGVNIQGLNSSLKKNLLAMAAEYGEVTGTKLRLTSAYRTKEQQKALHATNPNAAKPGSSNHEFGLAVDIDKRIVNRIESLGLFRKYGFTRPVGGEPWHVEPAGIQLDIDAAKKDPKWATQQIESSPGRGGGGYGASPGGRFKGRNLELAKSIFESGSEVKVNPKSVLEKEPENKTSVLTNSNSRKTPDVFNTNKNVSGPLSKETVGQLSKKLDSSTEKTQDVSISGSSQKPIKGYTAEFGSTASNDKSFERPNLKKGVEKTKELIKSAAERVGVDSSLLQLIAAKESSMGQNTSSGSSVSGPFQFMPATWTEQLEQFGDKYKLDKNTPTSDVTASALMTGEYLKTNTKLIQKHKANPDVVDYYLSHMLGPGGVQSFLKLSPDANAAEALKKEAKNNPEIFFKDGRKMKEPRTANEVRRALVENFKKLSREFGVNINLDQTGLDNTTTAKNTKESKEVFQEQPVKQNALFRPSGDNKEITKTNVNFKPNGNGVTSYEEEQHTAVYKPVVKQPKETLKGRADIASGMGELIQRGVEADEKLLEVVQNDMVPVLKKMYETLEKIYSQGGSKPQTDKNAPVQKTPDSRLKNPVVITSSDSILDRTRKYG